MLKEKLIKYRSPSKHETALSAITYGMKIFCGWVFTKLITYPFYVARVAMAADIGGCIINRRYSTMFDFFHKVYNDIGIGGFYSGFGLYLGIDLLYHLIYDFTGWWIIAIIPSYLSKHQIMRLIVSGTQLSSKETPTVKVID